MRKTILTALILLSGFALLAEEGKDKNKNASKGHVKTEVVDQKSFNVDGLKACQVESADEDGVEEYVPTTATSTTETTIDLMTEDIEDGFATEL